ncbi:MAG: RNA methyltransferase [Myxococcota bacterium]|nr:RNA methyltransferase [Myxococcota bacterium]
MNAPFEHVSVILVRPQHSGNIGAVARSIANHGLGPLIMVDPPAFDPDRARWMAPHASHIIDKALFTANLSQAVADLHLVIGATARNRKWHAAPLTLPELCEKCQSPTKIGLVFGPEDSGLSNDDLKHCHALITLPTHEHRSLNLSQAVNVFGAHLMATVPLEEEEKEQRPAISPSLEHKIQEQLVELALQALRLSDYTKSRSEVYLHNQLLRFIDGANLNHSDIVTLKGMCNKVYHTLRVLKQNPSLPKKSQNP